ncbi:MAG: LacI family DNA-binding transcriptional regulator [Planctomycetota bacterium]
MNTLRPSSRSVTQKTIASALNIDQTTVSRCFNTPDRVDLKTRERIMSKAKELGYRPNWRGRVFRRQQTRMIGLVHTDERITYSYGNSNLLGGLIGALHDRSYQLVHVRVAEGGEHTDSLVDARFDGCFVDYFVRDIEIDAIRQAALPAILINAAPKPGFPAVAPDHVEAGRLMGRHLLAHGHRRAAFFRDFHLPGVNHPDFTSEAWVAGLRETFREAGVGDGVIVVRPNREIDLLGRQLSPAFLEAMKSLGALNHSPTALIAESPTHAIDEISWQLPSTGLEAAGSVHVASMVDSPVLKRRSRPVSAIRMPYRMMGELAAKLLIQNIEDDGSIESPDLLPVELIDRHANDGSKH